MKKNEVLFYITLINEESDHRKITYDLRLTVIKLEGCFDVKLCRFVAKRRFVCWCKQCA